MLASTPAMPTAISVSTSVNQALRRTGVADREAGKRKLGVIGFLSKVSNANSRGPCRPASTNALGRRR